MWPANQLSKKGMITFHSGQESCPQCVRYSEVSLYMYMVCNTCWLKCETLTKLDGKIGIDFQNYDTISVLIKQCGCRICALQSSYKGCQNHNIKKAMRHTNAKIESCFLYGHSFTTPRYAMCYFVLELNTGELYDMDNWKNSHVVTFIRVLPSTM